MIKPTTIFLLALTLTAIVPAIAFRTTTAASGSSASVQTSRLSSKSAAPYVSIRTGIVPQPARSSSPRVSTDSLATTASSAVSFAAGFDGTNERNGGCYPCVPPDPILAVGPNHAMEMVNLARAVYNRQGVLALRQNLSIFFGTGTDFLSDPKILYDSQSQRWFASILQCGGVNMFSGCVGTFTGKIQVAVSNTTDPTGAWRFYTVTVGSQLLPDQPIIGVNDDKFVVSANIYTEAGGGFTFDGAEYWVLNKNDLTTGSTVHSQSFGPNINLESVHPVQSLSSTTTEYLVSTGAGDLGSSSSTVTLFALTGVPPSATVTPTTLTLASPVVTPPSAPQPCPRFCNVDYALLDTGDFRVQDAAWYSGGLWLGVNSDCKPNGVTDQACIRLIKLNTNTLSIAQEFDYGRAAYDYYYPALRIDSTGNLDLIFGNSHTSNPILSVSGQAANDPAGSLAPAVTVHSGSGNDYGAVRYGDYFGAAVDPNDPTQVWVVGEFINRTLASCGGVSCWDTWITQMRVLPLVSTNTFTGVTVKTNINLPGVSTTFPDAAVTATNSTTGQVLFTKSYIASGSKFLLNVGVSPYTLSSNVALSGGVYTVTLTRNVDINHDGIVNIIDLSTVGAHYGCSTGQACYYPQADLYADGTIDQDDLNLVSAWFGSTDYI